MGGWAGIGTKVQRWMVIGIKGLWAQSDRMLSIGDGQTHVRVLKVCPKKEKMLGVQMELSDGWTDGVWSCQSWQMDGWMGWKWYKGQEMDGDRNKRALGPVRLNVVHR